jgi:GT2 family glycosyltransferase
MPIINDKIGIGLITCDRPDFFKKSFFSLFDIVQEKTDIEYVVINDGKEKLPIYPINYIETDGYAGVAKAKNKALQYLIDNGCEHIFLMEDDVEIIDKNVFELYIKASNKTGIKHFNYGLHGNHNKTHLGEPNVLRTIQYPNTDISVDLYPNVLGAFSYYHIDTIKEVGLMDERFYNAMEHVDHTYQIIQKGYHPPFRYFADVNGSRNYLKDIVPDHQQSKIRSEKDFQQTFKKGLDVFIEKNNFSVVNGYGPLEKVATEEETIKCLKEIWKKHHQE